MKTLSPKKLCLVGLLSILLMLIVFMSFHKDTIQIDYYKSQLLKNHSREPITEYPIGPTSLTGNEEKHDAHVKLKEGPDPKVTEEPSQPLNVGTEKKEPIKKPVKVHVPDEIHPKSQADLWIKLSPSNVIRRVGYLDKRNLNDVRLNIILMQDKRQRPLPTVFVRLHYTDAKEPLCLSTELDHSAIEEGHDNYVLYLVRSPQLTEAQREPLSHVTVSTKGDCKDESIPIAIETVFDPKEYKYKFAMCLHKSVRPNLEPKVLLDWVKLNLALGTEFMTIFLQAGAEKIYEVLEPYVKKGVLEVLDWKLEPPLIDSVSYHDGQTGVIAECIWRNINSVKYLGMNDADEFFIPQKHHTLLEMMEELDRPMSKRYGSYLFTNTLMVDNGRLLPIVEKALSSNKCTGLDPMSLPVYFKRGKSCTTYAEKIIMVPNAASTAWPHHLFSYRADKYTKELRVPDSIGRSQHYRPTWDGYFHRCSPSQLSDSLSAGNYFYNVTGCTP